MKSRRLLLILFTSLFIVLFTGQIALAETDGGSGLVGLDTTFDTDGIITFSVQGSDVGDIKNDVYGQGIAFQPDGKILVSGNYWDGDASNGYYDLFLARYCENGSLDNGSNCGSPAFGVGGIAKLRISAEFGMSFDTAVMQLADGNILVGGDAIPGANQDFFLARFTSNGDIDTTFGGGDGIFYYDIDGSDIFRSFSQLPNGNILMGGYSGTNSLTLVQIKPDGSMDTSFNGDGITSFRIASASTTLNCFTVQPDGKIIIGGYLTPGISLVARLTSDGDLDTTFSAGDGSDGYYANDITPLNDGVTSVAIQPDGKVLASAYAYITTSPVNQNIVLFRFISDGSLDADFDGNSGSGNGIVTTQVIADTKNFPSEILLQSDEKFIVGGVAGNEYANEQDFAILRYTSAGLLDTTFNTTGFITTNVSSNDIWGSGKLTPDGKLVIAGTNGDYPYNDVSVLRYLTGVSETGSSAQVDTTTFTQIGNSNIWAQFDSGHTCTGGVITATKTLDYPGGSADTGEMPFYWDLSTDCSGEYSLTINYCFTDDELSQGNGATEANLELYKYSGGAWVDQNGAVDTALNCVQKTGITSLSNWTLADPSESSGPTAIHMISLAGQSPKNISPRFYIVVSVLVTGVAGLNVLMMIHRKKQLLRNCHCEERFL